MPLKSNVVGARTESETHIIDRRWPMAYAAALSDFNSAYFPNGDDDMLAHPVFPVCLEWPIFQNSESLNADIGLSAGEAVKAVHASHDLHLYRPIRPGDKLVTMGTVVDVSANCLGASSTMRLDTTNNDTGELVARTYQTAIYRGVDIEGGHKHCEELPTIPDTHVEPNEDLQEIDIPRGLAHIYSECARIWNPIHTDRDIANQAGLPDIILHGTATLAIAVSQLVDKYTDGDPSTVVRLGGRFSALVLIPSKICLESSIDGKTVFFQVRNEAGDLAITKGFLCVR